MLRSTLLTTTVLLTLSGCARLADSPVNPLNWFGNSEEVAVDANGEIRPLTPAGFQTETIDARPLVQSITAMSIDRSPTGAIVRATAIAPTQGFFNAQLVNAGTANGVLTLEFRAQAPSDFEAEGSARSRQITAAYVIDAADLSTVRSVRVQSATNARSSAR